MKKYLLFLFIMTTLEYGHAQDNRLSGREPSKKFRFSSGSYFPEQNIAQANAAYPFSHPRYNLTDIRNGGWQQRTRENERTQPKKTRSQSVSRFTIKVYSGNGFLTPGSYRIQSNNNVSYGLSDPNGVIQFRDTTIKTQSKKGIGGGFRFGGGIGFALNDFLSIGVDAEYQKGDRVSNSLATSVDAYHYASSDDEMSYHAITLTPHVIFKALAKPKYFIYNRLGILFTLPFNLNTSGHSITTRSTSWPPVTASDSVSGYWLIENKSYNQTYKIALGIGFNVAFGINFRLNNKWRMFGEVAGNFSGLSPSSAHYYSATKTKSTSYVAEYDYTVPPPYPFLGYSVGGYKNIDYVTTNTTYIKGGGTSNTEIYSPNTGLLGPDSEGYNQWGFEYAVKDKKFPVNMNAISINFGIIYRF
jgi:hypothetical protein